MQSFGQPTGLAAPPSLFAIPPPPPPVYEYECLSLLLNA